MRCKAGLPADTGGSAEPKPTWSRTAGFPRKIFTWLTTFMGQNQDKSFTKQVSGSPKEVMLGPGTAQRSEGKDTFCFLFLLLFFFLFFLFLMLDRKCLDAIFNMEAWGTWHDWRQDLHFDSLMHFTLQRRCILLYMQNSPVLHLFFQVLAWHTNTIPLPSWPHLLLFYEISVVSNLWGFCWV